MYCSNCGNKLNSNDKFCSNCGNSINKKEKLVEDTKESENKASGLKIASIVLGSIAILGNLVIIGTPLSIFLAISGLIIAIISCCKKEKNIIGIVLNGISLLLSILFISFIIKIVKFIPSTIDKGSNMLDKYTEKYNNSEYGNFFDEFFGDFFDEYNFNYGNNNDKV